MTNTSLLFMYVFIYLPIYLFICISGKNFALAQLINYQLCNLSILIQLTNHTLETNIRCTTELSICAAGHITMSNLTYSARLLDCQRLTPVVSMKVTVIRLFFRLGIEILLVSGCCTSLYVSLRILQVFPRFSGVSGTEFIARRPDVLLMTINAYN